MSNYYTNGDKVAWLYHDGYGTGWYSEHGIQELCTDPKLCQYIDNEQLDLAAARLHELVDKYKLDTYIQYYWSLNIDVMVTELAIHWIPRGKKFIVHNYDGLETVWLKEDIKWVIV